MTLLQREKREPLLMYPKDERMAIGLWQGASVRWRSYTLGMLA